MPRKAIAPGARVTILKLKRHVIYEVIVIYVALSGCMRMTPPLRVNLIGSSRDAAGHKWDCEVKLIISIYVKLIISCSYLVLLPSHLSSYSHKGYCCTTTIPPGPGTQDTEGADSQKGGRRRDAEVLEHCIT
jgi:hypothetical protein